MEEDYGPAFPISLVSKVAAEDGSLHDVTFVSRGMSLRDWFAGQALMGFCSKAGTSISRENAAASAYDCADEMLLARSRAYDEDQ